MSDEFDNDMLPSLGACCMCQREPAIAIVMLSRRLPPGSEGGWACVLCNIAGGAYAVLCEPCIALYSEDNSHLTQCCAGYPASGERIAIADLPAGKFDHDPARHPEMLQLTLSPSERIADVNLPGDLVVPARVWEGHTTSGTPVLAYIVGVVPLDMGSDVDAEFAALRLIGSQTASRL